ncbi:glycosyltransferase [Pseudodesulfovibrio methanolicus]|uniref:Glycosyltransferase n=1 Tax=Pseudodesulfovibrio methanolicus TaxID=3126690 RepID=A0ABZ2IV78_9BACT
MKKKKRVLFYLPTIGQGGIERVIEHIIDQLHDRVDFCVSGQRLEENSILSRERLGDKAELFDAPGIDMMANRYLPKNVYKLKGYVDRFRPDILFSFWHLPNLVAGLLLSLYPKSKRPRWVLSVHNQSPGFDREKGYKGKFLSSLLVGVARCSDTRITVAPRLIPGCEAYYGQKFDLYYNPAVDDRLSDLAKDDPGHPWLTPDNNTILSIGRLDIMKDFPTLIGAFDIVRKDVPDARLVILGDGPKRNDLQAMIDDRGIADKVDLVGYVANPYAYLSRCRMFALTSTHGEASPMVLAEAMFFSRPVVCTEFYTAPDYIGDNVNGLLAKCKDTGEVAEKILMVLKDQDGAAGRAEHAREMVLERHGVENAARRYFDLISRL